MSNLYVFTWNLQNNQNAHDLALQHLSQRAKKDCFVACLQELPQASQIAQARRVPDSTLLQANIAVVRTNSLVKGLAIVHHIDLTPNSAEKDEDTEFLAVRLSDTKGEELIVVGVHLKSQVDMNRSEDRGGCRANFRHGLNQYLNKHPNIDVLVLGDWNSDITSREVRSWHCGYALGPSDTPLTAKVKKSRRGLPHPPLFQVRPVNMPEGTLEHADDGLDSSQVFDFAAHSDRLQGKKAKILKTLQGTRLRGASQSFSDHIPYSCWIAL